MSTFNNCPVCKFETSFTVGANGGATICCSNCGTFEATEGFLTKTIGRPVEDSHIYSGGLREHYLSGNHYILNDLDSLRRSVWVPKNPIDQIDKLLLSIEKRASHFGQIMTYDCNTNFPEAYAKNADEYFHLLQNAHYLQYVECNCTNPQGSISLKWQGADRLAKLHNSDINSNQAFVAMWFDERMDEILENGIVRALEETGFKPLVINKKQFNTKVDYEIIASIKQSGLVVADVTGHRQNVYFEAGYAMGLGIEVIWTCSESSIKKAHFDTRQYPHILWTDADDLKAKLINRIKATLPVRIS